MSERTATSWKLTRWLIKWPLISGAVAIGLILLKAVVFGPPSESDEKTSVIKSLTE
ncbi:MAG: hypothetical protein KJO40_09235 [Deltaproteobacteria bacterium]|nr:hypothetical protein [Deltaproteobacteria bacterium]NND29778.1 hypothetical protein [Myxococcales bacterium]MBT8465548.1 hypothetical protein [Deltaproteobacteria bacterium]MBT8480620.1 hypothetical protein [Deltaproteobacteria bacterium]NNK07043.1 hypothetical protein [Myxococcales bacterium]